MAIIVINSIVKQACLPSLWSSLWLLEASCLLLSKPSVLEQHISLCACCGILPVSPHLTARSLHSAARTPPVSTRKPVTQGKSISWDRGGERKDFMQWSHPHRNPAHLFGDVLQPASRAVTSHFSAQSTYHLAGVSTFAAVCCLHIPGPASLVFICVCLVGYPWYWL